VMTPDARGLVYQIDTATADIEYRSLHADTTATPIAVMPGAESAARLSADGRLIAFNAAEGGAGQVIVQEFPGPGPRVQVSVAGGVEPVWAREGHRLYYRSNGQIYSADIVTSPSLAVRARTPLLDDTFVLAVGPHANFDTAPDGRLLFLRQVGSQGITVIYGWASAVRERLDAARLTPR
jgi:hypothetical protein